MPAPTTSGPPPATDLSDAEFDRLADALADAPAPTEPLDAVSLDGYLCGVLVQPRLLALAEWLPWALDAEGRDTDPAWRASVEPLVLRRHAALNRAMVEDGAFAPLLLGFDAEHPPAVSEYEPLAVLPPVSQVLAPWVAGFAQAEARFGGLQALDDDEVRAALARVWQHLPPAEPGSAPMPAVVGGDPMAGLEAAVDAVVDTVVELSDRTHDARYHVETVRRADPKVGRNDPCPCGSGRKFKRCHGS